MFANVTFDNVTLFISYIFATVWVRFKKKNLLYFLCSVNKTKRGVVFRHLKIKLKIMLYVNYKVKL